jgi:integrase
MARTQQVAQETANGMEPTMPLDWSDAMKLISISFKNYGHTGEYRPYLLFVIGFYTGFRVSDLLRMTWATLLDTEEIFVTKQSDRKFLRRNMKSKKKVKFNLVEQKTSKNRKFFVHDEIKKALEIIYDPRVHNKEHYIFHYGKNKLPTKQSQTKHWSRVAVDNNIKYFFGMLEIDTPTYSAHSLRKTWALRVYNVVKDQFTVKNIPNPSEEALMTVSDIMNHSSTRMTRIYLGFQRDSYDIYEEM